MGQFPDIGNTATLKTRPLLWQVTAFTFAHTITLRLSMYGIIQLSPALVEPLIVASIVYVGVENIVSGVLRNWRILLVFLFGLLHGMGFAGVLNELGLPEGEFVTALKSCALWDDT
ncbi:MAG: HupE/UreJ family protein [Gammaproteobacteria bacterium]|nr:HupE/UreJ family protein [Gammaproteobacteria bacterium]